VLAQMRNAGSAVELLETRHVRIAALMRLGWFRPVHCKSMEAQETRAMLTARKLVQSKLHDVERSLRGILRGFGLNVSKKTPKRFEGRIKELAAGHPSLEVVTAALLRVHSVLLREFNDFEKRVRSLARHDARARLLITHPGGSARDHGAHRAASSPSFAARILDVGETQTLEKRPRVLNLPNEKHQ
jgi:transposase